METTSNNGLRPEAVLSQPKRKPKPNPQAQGSAGQKLARVRDDVRQLLADLEAAKGDCGPQLQKLIQPITNWSFKFALALDLASFGKTTPVRSPVPATSSPKAAPTSPESGPVTP